MPLTLCPGAYKLSPKVLRPVAKPHFTMESDKIFVENFFSYFLILLEQFWINGLWAGWGQLAVHFKENDYFTDYCTNSTEAQDCSER